MPDADRIVLRGGNYRRALHWLLLAMAWSGLMGAVFLSIRGDLGCLAIGSALGAPLFVVAFLQAWSVRTVVLLPSRRRLQFVEGLVLRRTREYEFDDVVGAEVCRAGGSWRVVLEFRDGALLALAGLSEPEARSHRGIIETHVLYAPR